MIGWKDGGPAFPGPGMNSDAEPWSGMALRDYFAAHVLAGMCANGSRAFAEQAAARGVAVKAALAVIAYEVADAMLEERKRAR